MFSILVVEDNEVLNEMISTKLKLESYDVYSAFDGEEALNILENMNSNRISNAMRKVNLSFEASQIIKNKLGITSFMSSTLSMTYSAPSKGLNAPC